jgi:hypothetical protein
LVLVRSVKKRQCTEQVIAQHPVAPEGHGGGWGGGSPPVMTLRVHPSFTLVVLSFHKRISRLILWLLSHTLFSALVTGLYERKDEL